MAKTYQDIVEAVKDRYRDNPGDHSEMVRVARVSPEQLANEIEAEFCKAVGFDRPCGGMCPGGLIARDLARAKRAGQIFQKISQDPPPRLKAALAKLQEITNDPYQGFPKEFMDELFDAHWESQRPFTGEIYEAGTVTGDLWRVAGGDCDEVERGKAAERLTQLRDKESGPGGVLRAPVYKDRWNAWAKTITSELARRATERNKNYPNLSMEEKAKARDIELWKALQFGLACSIEKVRNEATPWCDYYRLVDEEMGDWVMENLIPDERAIDAHNKRLSRKAEREDPGGGDTAPCPECNTVFDGRKECPFCGWRGRALKGRLSHISIDEQPQTVDVAFNPSDFETNEDNDPRWGKQESPNEDEWGDTDTPLDGPLGDMAVESWRRGSSSTEEEDQKFAQVKMGLSPKDQAILEQRYLGMTFEIIAERLGVEAATARKRYERAIRRAQDQAAKIGIGEDEEN